jgi:mannose-6-phosphate isomerase-like protein (cupin superfamily)
MDSIPRRVVTGHDQSGKSVVLWDGPPPQRHPMHGPDVGADFFEIWNSTQPVPVLTAVEPEPNERAFSIMPASGHLLRIIEIYPPGKGGKRTVMHRTRTVDYVVVITGEIVLVLDDSEVILRPGDVAVQRGTDHAWENRSNEPARMAFFHIDAQFSEELLRILPKPLDLMR